MSDYRPSLKTVIAVLATFFVIVLPAIWFSAMGYMWLVEHGLKVDTAAQPESIADRLVVLLLLLPMIPVMVLAICIAGIPWMFIMSRILPWPDIEYFTGKKGPRIPVLSIVSDRMWLRMIESRKRGSPTDQRNVSENGGGG